MSNLKKLITSAIFVSLIVVFGKLFTITTPYLRIGFSFIPIMIAAIILGPIWTSAVCILADIVGVILIPHGNWFLGFTISALLVGVIYGYFLQNKGKEISEKEFLIKLCISAAIVTFFVDASLNTLWLTLLYGKAFFVLLPTRLTAQLIMLPIKIIVVYTLNKLLQKPIIKFVSK